MSGTVHGSNTKFGFKTPHRMPLFGKLDISKVLSDLVSQLYPTGRAFFVNKDGIMDKTHSAINKSFIRILNDSVSTLNSTFPDNENFTIEDEWEEIKTIPIDDIHKYFVVNYASTIYKNQGLTIKAPRKVVIYDWLFQSQYKRVKYTILTRVQKLEQLYIGEKEDAPSEQKTEFSKTYLTCGQRPEYTENDIGFDDYDDYSLGDEDLYAL